MWLDLISQCWSSCYYSIEYISRSNLPIPFCTLHSLEILYKHLPSAIQYFGTVDLNHLPPTKFCFLSKFLAFLSIIFAFLVTLITVSHPFISEYCSTPYVLPSEWLYRSWMSYLLEEQTAAYTSSHFENTCFLPTELPINLPAIIKRRRGSPVIIVCLHSEPPATST